MLRTKELPIDELDLNSEFVKPHKTVVVTHEGCGGHMALPEETDDPSLRMRQVRGVYENPTRLEVYMEFIMSRT